MDKPTIQKISDLQNVKVRLFPFESGDCQDYKTWLLADRGIKEERTVTSESTRTTIEGILTAAAKEPHTPTHFVRRGNVLYPE